MGWPQSTTIDQISTPIICAGVDLHDQLPGPWGKCRTVLWTSDAPRKKLRSGGAGASLILGYPSNGEGKSIRLEVHVLFASLSRSNLTRPRYSAVGDTTSQKPSSPQNLVAQPSSKKRPQPPNFPTTYNPSSKIHPLPKSQSQLEKIFLKSSISFPISLLTCGNPVDRK